MTKLHERTFRQSADDVERDELLAIRCAALQFVVPAHLEIPDGVVDEAALGRAAAELNKINNYKVRHAGMHARGHAAGGQRQTCCSVGAVSTLTRRSQANSAVMPHCLAAGGHVLTANPLPALNTLAVSAVCAGSGSLQAPRDKLVCILNCCRMLNNLLTSRSKAEGIGEGGTEGNQAAGSSSTLAARHVTAGWWCGATACVHYLGGVDACELSSAVLGTGTSCPWYVCCSKACVFGLGHCVPRMM